MRTLAALIGLSLLAGCAQTGPTASVPTPNLPASLASIITDPARTAINNTAAVFGNPASVQGRPIAVAEAISQLEWLTPELSNDQRFIGMPPTVAGSVRQGRDAVREAFGVRPDTSPQAAVNAFDAAAAAYRANDPPGAQTALAAVTGADGAARAASLLSALPRIPQAAAGTSAAVSGLAQMNERTPPRR
ncbi:hypothetical protein DFH01_26385 [Falsiroseomonas bella]|uniref:Uncharacterized protein n=1 Tax=Falsiroseomonas bella TaxID=2184016 RepID=A0A317F875_9PROT|nr:hypothetical protein [Falsiroseomonas bella]PWS34159.1 hypothetical protein DFH01_26385 [Falsiroseomonas bella]